MQTETTLPYAGQEILPPRFKTLDEVEREHILKALTMADGNKTEASMMLGITIKTLYNRLLEYGLTEEYRKRKPY